MRIYINIYIYIIVYLILYVILALRNAEMTVDPPLKGGGMNDPASEKEVHERSCVPKSSQSYTKRIQFRRAGRPKLTKWHPGSHELNFLKSCPSFLGYLRHRFNDSQQPHKWHQVSSESSASTLTHTTLPHQNDLCSFVFFLQVLSVPHQC